MTLLRHFLAVCGLGAIAAAGAQEPIAANLVATLAPTIASPQAVEAVPVLTQPAEVIVPPAHHHVAIAPLAGRVTAIAVTVGEPVQAGQVLARIYSPELLAHQRDFLLAQAAYKHMRHVYEREESLAQEGIISQRRLDEAEHDVLEQRTAFESAERMLAGLGMTPEDIKALDEPRAIQPILAIRSAVAGTITMEHVDLGEGVSAGDVLFGYADTRKLWLSIHVDSAFSEIAEVGRLVYAGPCEGAIRRVSDVLDPQSQTLLVTAELQSDCSLKAGQQLAVQLTQPAHGSYRVPRSAVFNSDGRDWVFAIHDGVARAVAVRLSGVDSDFRYLSFATEPPQQIATSRLADLKAAWLGMGGE